MISTYVHVTNLGAGSKNGSDWANAFDWAAFDAYTPSAGTLVAIMGGQTYAITSAYAKGSVNGSEGNPIYLAGVKPGTTHEGASIVASDISTLQTDKPILDIAPSLGYGLTTGNNWSFESLYLKSDGTTGLISSLHENNFVHCDFEGTGSTNFSRYCLLPNGVACIIRHCTFKGNLYGLFCLEHNIIQYNVFHSAHLAVWLSAGGTGSKFTNNIFVGSGDSECLAGNGYGHSFQYNTFYNLRYAIFLFNGYGYTQNRIAHNIVHSCGNGANACFQAAIPMNISVEDNHFFNCAVKYGANIGTDVWTGDRYETSGDPLFVDPVNLDFSLQTGSPCIGAARDLSLGVGSGNNHGNKGAWQSCLDTAAAIAAYQVANNTAPSNSNNSLLPTETCKVGGVTYTGPAAGSNVIFTAVEDARTDTLQPNKILLNYNPRSKGGVVRGELNVDGVGSLTGEAIIEEHTDSEVLTTAAVRPGKVVLPPKHKVEKDFHYGAIN